MQTEQRALEFTSDNSSRSIRDVNQNDLDCFDGERDALLESSNDVLDMVIQWSWMVSADSKAAYYSIAIHEDFTEFLTMLGKINILLFYIYLTDMAQP